MHYYLGNFLKEVEEAPNSQVWLIGQFLRDKFDDARGNLDCSVKYWRFEKGKPTGHPAKYQKLATEVNFLLKGRLRSRVEDKEFVFNAGEYIVLRPGVTSNLALETLEDAEGITIKAPSCDPDDTVKLP